jgi:hypothetical protein
MRFVAIKSVERARELLVKQRTQLMNCLRSQLAELAQAAKTARIAWAMLISGETYPRPSRAG